MKKPKDESACVQKESHILRHLIELLVMVSLMVCAVTAGEKMMQDEPVYSSSNSYRSAPAGGEGDIVPWSAPTGEDVQPQFHEDNEASTLFLGLDITNFSVKKSDGSYVLSCDVKNGNSVRLFGYFRVCFYDSNDAPMHEQSFFIDDIEAGASQTLTAACSESKYPADFARYAFVDGALTEWVPTGGDATEHTM